MDTGLYRIEKLKWDGKVTKEEYSQTQAYTRFGSYKVIRFSDGLRWGYCFDEYYDEDTFHCESVADGKRKAEQDWLERIKCCLVPATPPDQPAEEER